MSKTVTCLGGAQDEMRKVIDRLDEARSAHGGHDQMKEEDAAMVAGFISRVAKIGLEIDELRGRLIKTALASH